MVKPSVIIIGAGATGLIAAKELAPGFKVIVLEAETRTGGRLRSISKDGNIFEAGAEFIHGNLPVTLGLLKEAGIPYVRIAGKMYRKKNGRLSRVEEMTENWDGMLEIMKALKEDITLQEFLEKNYPGPENEMLRRHAKSYAEGFDLAEISKASVKSLYMEWSAEDYDNYRISQGHSALSHYLQQQAEEAGAVILTGTPAKKVEWQQGTATVHAANGEKYSADKLLVTVPVSVLQQPDSKASIHFKPAIHFNENLAGKIGYGAVIKLVLKFKSVFWQEDTGFILSDEGIPTWWTQLPDNTPILTGWLGGLAAADISNESDEAIVEKALESLSAIFDRSVTDLKMDLDESMVFNWQKYEYSMGAYSYNTLHSEVAKSILATPLSGTIFFAGEALYTGDHPGTVEAALVSGINAAATIKNTLIDD